MKLSVWYMSAFVAWGNASHILKLSSFSDCVDAPDIVINNADVQYNDETRVVQFDIAGESTKSENVTATLQVTAYGKEVYTNEFNPCDSATFVQQLCPVPVGNFSAASTQVIPAQYASQIPAVAFSIPDIALQATIELKSLDDGKNVGCVVADLSNGKSVNSPAITYAAVGVTVATVALTGLSAMLNGGSAGEPGSPQPPSPNLMQMFSWFQSVATSGMLSVDYPPLYRSFTERFAFSTGLITWPGLQESIDTFRSKTGGNITINNIGYLKNATLVFNGDESTGTHITRSLWAATMHARDFSFGGSGNATGTPSSDVTLDVSGIQAYVEQSGIVQENTFMTVFLIGCIVCLAIVVGILLFKVILEIWALCGKFPPALIGFREHYWGTTFRTIVNLIQTFFGMWVLYSIFQFKSGDSWAATTLAAVTLAVFAGILLFFTLRIIQTARRYVKTYGSTAALFEEKKAWLKYSLFYNIYRKSTWWFFITVIAYNFIRNFLLAALNGKGLAQTVSVLSTEALMFLFCLFIRPCERKMDNVVTIMIQLVRTLSMAGVLVFVDELNVQKSSQTILGFALIILNLALTAILVILMIINTFIMCCAMNPHRKRRKDAEKRKRESAALMDQYHHDSTNSNPNIMMYTRKSRVGDGTQEPLYNSSEV